MQKKKTSKNTKKKTALIKKVKEVKVEVKKEEAKKESNLEEKISTSKNIEKENLKKTDFKLIFLVALAIVLLGVVYIYFSSPNGGYTYFFNRGGINYYSNILTPNESFTQLKQQSVVYVSPILEENKASPYFTNSLNLWQIVLIGNKINPIQLIRVTENNELIYCYTNFGNVTDSNQISVQNCKAVLNNNENFVVYIEEGNKGVLLENNKITVSSKETESGQVNFAVIKEIFPNAQEILDIVNQKIYGIS